MISQRVFLPPCKYKLPITDRIPTSSYANSRFEKHLKNLSRAVLNDQTYISFFHDDTCLQVVQNDFLDAIGDESMEYYQMFYTMYQRALPRIILQTPSNALLKIINSNPENEAFLSDVRLSLLYHRISRSKTFQNLIIIAKESIGHIPMASNHVVAYFLQQYLISFAKIAVLPKRPQKDSFSKFLKKNDLFLEHFLEATNILLYTIAVYKTDVLACSPIAQLMIDIIQTPDCMAPSVQALNDYPKDVTFTSALTTCIILGQIHAYALETERTKKSGANELYYKFPFQVCGALSFLYNKNKLYYNESVLSDEVFNEFLKNDIHSINHFKIKSNIEAKSINNIMCAFIDSYKERIVHHNTISFLTKAFVSNSDYTYDPLLLFVLVGKLLNSLALFLAQYRFGHFLEISGLIMEIIIVCDSQFSSHSAIKSPILYFLDLLIASPYFFDQQPRKVGNEIIQNYVEEVMGIIKKDPISWMNYIFAQPACEANIYILNYLFTNFSNTQEIYDVSCLHLESMLSQSIWLLKPLNYPCIKLIYTFWATIVSFLSKFNQNNTIRFAYASLKFIANSVTRLKEDSLAGICYILQLLELVLSIPIYHYTFCSFDQLFSSLLSLESLMYESPEICYMVFLVYKAIFGKNGTTTLIHSIFGLPPNLAIYRIAKISIKCIKNTAFLEFIPLIGKCISLISNNKYTSSIINPIMKEIPSKFHFSQATPYSVSLCDLHQEVFQLLPNIASKAIIGFEIWKSGATTNMQSELISDIKNLVKELPNPELR